MSSSGWQGQKNVQTSKYPHMALNLYITSISHSGTQLNYNGYVKVVCTSGYISYNNATVTLTGGGSKSVNLNLNSSGTTSVNTGTFYCGVSGVGEAATTANVTASLSAGSAASGSATWTLSFNASATAPTVTVTNISSTWDSITADVDVTNWGGGTLKAFIFKVANRAYVQNVSALQDVHQNVDSATSTITNNSEQYTGTIDTVPVLKGMGQYYLGVHAGNGVVSTHYQAGSTYLPPAPAILQSARQGTSNDWTVTVKNTPANNIDDYATADLTYTVRYQEDGSGTWVTWKNAVSTTIDAVNTMTKTVGAGHSCVIQAWYTYKGFTSQVAQTTIDNTSIPVHTYGSVNGLSKELAPIYGSVDGESVTLQKIYAGDSNNTARLIYIHH